MSALTLPVTPGTLPSGACPATYQEMLNLFSANQTVPFPSTFTGVILSSTAPSDTTKAWFQLDSFGRPVRLYAFASGAWLSLHPCVPGFTMIWTTTLPTMTTFDGGDANPVSAISGPMWEEVVSLRAAFPLGAGTLPSGTVVAAGGTGGVETVTLGSTNVPAHNHDLWVGSSDGTASGVREALQTVDNPHGGTAAKYALSDGVTGHNNYVQSEGGDGSGAAVAHTNMPPYVGVFFLRRTNRLFYTV